MRRLAVGGMGEIFLAHDARGELVVLKTLLPIEGDDGAAARMFLEEARLTALIDHRNVVKVLEVFEDGDEPVIAMEYVQGESLGVLVRTAMAARRHQRAPFVAAVAQAAWGLAAAHRATDASGRPLYLVHRDVSPQNILVGRDGVVRLIDFGIAKVRESTGYTRTGVVKGKLAYLSPEQLAGQGCDARADLYALGVVLWEATLGRRAFQASSEVELLRKVSQEEIERPCAVDPGFDPALERIIMQAVARAPEHRFQSGEALATALEQYLERLAPPGEPLAAYVESLLGSNLDARQASMASAVDWPAGWAHVGRLTAPTVTVPVATPPARELPVAAEASLFEALFGEGAADDGLRDDLLHVGVDPQRLEALYRVDAWARAIDLVRRHRYPDLPSDDANQRLGHDFARGLAATVGGRMMVSLLPLLGTASLLAKVPRFLKLGRHDLAVTWEPGPASSGTVRIHDVAQVSPYFSLGLIQYLLERIGAAATGRVEYQSLADFALHFEW